MPEVRFKALDKIYNKFALSEVVDKVKSYSLSRDIETVEFTGYKYIHYGDIHTKKAGLVEDSNTLPNIIIGDYISLKKDDLVLADASEDYQGIATPALILNIPKQKLIAGLHTIALRPKVKYSSIYIYYLLHSQSFKKFGYRTGTGIKVFGINYPNLIKFENLYPTFEEQQKIGTFLKQLDDTISLQQQLVEQQQQYKKAMLQRMFPHKGERVPEIRFDGFSGDWEEKKLEYFIQDFTEKTTIQNQYPVLTSSQKYGIILQEDYFADRQVTTNNNIGYFVLPRGYFTFRSRSDNGVFKFNRNDLVDRGIISYFYPVFNIVNGDSNFFLMLLNSTTKRQVFLEAEGTGQKVLSLKKFKNIRILIPSLEEQQKIGGFFKQLDDTIALHQKKCEDYQQLKKALLQRMFV